MHDAPHVVVVGGGLAGLAVTAALAERACRVTLLESRPRLGGRASSFVDQTTGALVDNCQHVSLGCCTNFRHFCETVGIAARLRRERELYFVGPSGKVHRFHAAKWPAPFHLLPAFRRLDYLSRIDLRSIAHGLRALAKPEHDALSEASDEPFSVWLQRHEQTPTAIERFWFVVLVSALSESLDRVDVRSARKVFVDAFLAHREGWQVEIPTVPLSDFYGQTLSDWLETRGVRVRLLDGVRSLDVADDRAVGVTLRNGERLPADHVVLAVPHHRVLSLLPQTLADHPELRSAGELDSAPISSVHLWFDKPFTDLPHAVFVERTSQWFFNRSALQTGPTDGQDWYCQVVISASHDLAGRSADDVTAEVLAELREVWPAAAESQLRHSRLVTEHRAVFSVRPGAERLRPPQQAPLPNLQLAGDWTRTGWPATMEGAVRSGYLAAENVLAQLGRPQQLVRPDLRPSWLSKILFGLRRHD